MTGNDGANYITIELWIRRLKTTKILQLIKKKFKPWLQPVNQKVARVK